MPAATSSDELDLEAARWYPVTVEKVWAQCTSKRALERWWSPEDLRTTVKRFDARLGGEVVMSMRYVPAMLGPQGEDAFRAAGVPISFSLRGTVREFEKNRRLVLELTLSLDRAGSGITTVTTIELEARDLGTAVRLGVSGRSDPHLAVLGRANLAGQLDRLGQALGPLRGSSPAEG
jgi:uncharacterized protein YndB with AHSA1/START domain